MKKIIIMAIMAAFTMVPTSMVGQENMVAPEMDAPATVEMVAAETVVANSDAPTMVAAEKKRNKSHESIELVATQETTAVEPTVAEIKVAAEKPAKPTKPVEPTKPRVINDETVDNMVVPKQDIVEPTTEVTEEPVVEEPTEEVGDEMVVPDEEPVELDQYDIDIANGDYCEAREHCGDEGKHKRGTGCKFEEKHPEECEGEE